MICVLHSSSTATWPLDPSKDEKQGWRHIRIKQMGKNASGQTHYLSLSGLEIYGTVSGVCEDQLGKIFPADPQTDLKPDKECMQLNCNTRPEGILTKFEPCSQK